MPQPRKPTAVLEQTGAFARNPKRKKARENEPQPTGPLGEPPEGLDGQEQKAWRYLASLIPPGVARNSDRVAMEEMSRLYVACQSNRATLGERQLLQKYQTMFGMTPADRSRVKADPEKQKV